LLVNAAARHKPTLLLFTQVKGQSGSIREEYSISALSDKADVLRTSRDAA